MILFYTRTVVARSSGLWVAIRMYPLHHSDQHLRASKRIEYSLILNCPGVDHSPYDMNAQMQVLLFEDCIWSVCDHVYVMPVHDERILME